MYYYPASGVNLSTADCYIGYLSSPNSDIVANATTTSGNMIYINGASNVTIKNLTIEGSTWLYPSTYSCIPRSQDGLVWSPTDKSSTFGCTMPAVVQMYNAKNIVIDNVHMHNCAGFGVSMGANVNNSTVENSLFENIGGGAVNVGYHRNSNKSDNTLVNKYMKIDGNTVTNNTIRNTSFEQAGCPAIKVWHSSNTTISHNTIENVGCSGISVGWGWHAQLLSNTVSSGPYTIDSNYVDGVCMVLEDGAPYYSLGYILNGATITNNVFANSYDGINEIPSVTNTGYHGGIYCDEGSFNETFKNNVIYGCRQWMSSRYGAVNGNIVFNNTYTTSPEKDPNIAEKTSSGAMNSNCNYFGYFTNDYDFDGIATKHISTTVTNFTQVTNDNWPTAAKAIMDAAGAK